MGTGTDMHYKYKDGFEGLTRIKVDKVVVDRDGTEHYLVLTELGGHDEEEYFQTVLEGPAEGERVYFS